MKRSARRVVTVLAVGAIAPVTACGSPDTAETSGTTLTIAAVDNHDLERLRELSEAFIAEHPDVTLEWVTQSENEIRQTISTDVGTQAGRFDIVTVGTYEAEVWADQDLLSPLTDMPSGFEADAFIPALREALSHEGDLQAAPFYGESQFTMYRTDVLDAAGVEMPDEPTWADIIDAATQLSGSGDIAPVCLRGEPGWGQNVATLSAMAHSYGARWFDEDWTAQLDSPEWTQVFEDYVTLARLAPGDPAANGYQENLEMFAAGECAIWIDTTAAASTLTDPEQSSVADDVAFTHAPHHDSGPPAAWLWSWALAVPTSSEHEELAKEFVTWATSREYTELVAEEYGWLNVPPGTRTDLYENPAYLDAAPFAPLVLESIEAADVTNPTTTAVPYVGIQYVAIPVFQSIGTAVGQQLTDAITGQTPIPKAQENAQWVTSEIIGQARMVDGSDGTD